MPCKETDTRKNDGCLTKVMIVAGEASGDLHG